MTKILYLYSGGWGPQILSCKDNELIQHIDGLNHLLSSLNAVFYINYFGMETLLLYTVRHLCTDLDFFEKNDLAKNAYLFPGVVQT